MALSDKDIDRISDKIAIKVSDKLEEHRLADHKPLERRINRVERRSNIFHGLQASALAILAALKGH